MSEGLLRVVLITHSLTVTIPILHSCLTDPYANIHNDTCPSSHHTILNIIIKVTRDSGVDAAGQHSSTGGWIGRMVIQHQRARDFEGGGW